MPDATDWRMGTGFEVLRLESGRVPKNGLIGFHYLEVVNDRPDELGDITNREIDERLLSYHVEPGDIVVRRWSGGFGRLTIAVHGPFFTLLCCGPIPDVMTIAARGRRMHEVFDDPFFAAGTRAGDLEIESIVEDDTWGGLGITCDHLPVSALIRTKGPPLKPSHIPFPIKTVTRASQRRRA